MKVLATTSQSVLIIDCVSGDARVLHRGAGLYYGITRAPNGYAIGARRRLVSSSVPREDERGCILLFDERFREQERIEPPFPLRDVHEIAWFDRQFWITCSFDDLIAVFDGAGWRRWVPPLPEPRAERRDAANDRYHLNSWFVDEHEIGLLAHNHGPSDVHFFDRRSLAYCRSMELGRQSHNLWRRNGAYATCSSIEGKLVASDGWELATGGFPRGICFDSGYRAVGISALSERGQRDWASAAIALYDASWRLLHYVHLVREGMVLDLELLSPDEYRVADAALARRAFPLIAQLDDADLLQDHGSSGETSR